MIVRLWVALGEWPGTLLLAVALIALLLVAGWTGMLVARRQRHLSDTQLRTLFDLIPAMIWFKDTANRHLRVNQRVADAAGLKVSDIEGRHCSETYPDHADRYYAEDLEIMASRQPKIGFIESLTAQDGTHRWIRTDKVPYFDQTGKPAGVLVISHDVTEQKATSDALQEERNRLAFITASAPGAIFAFQTKADYRPSFLYLSERIEDVTGFTAATLLSDAEAAISRMHPDDRLGARASLLEAARTLSLWTMAFRYRHPLKGDIWIEGRATPSIEATGGLVWHGFLVDVTERKLLEEQFRQAQKMEAIGQLAGGVAHDFNNILMVIQGNASLLQSCSNDPKERRFLHEIIEASNRAAGLTRQLLLFGRKQVMRPIDVDLNSVVANMTKMLQRILGEDVTLEAHFSPGLPHIFADPGMIEQIVLNLAVNSRDAMPAGGTLSVSTGRCAEPPRGAVGAETGDPWVYVKVTDTGSGIPAGVLPHIFEPFFTTKEVGRGTGLGLATVYGVVQQHGGWVSVDSVEGRGTMFQIGFPAASSAALRAITAPMPDSVPRGAETILVVEDEPAVCEMVAALLQHWGYHVLTAESGRAALTVWHAHASEIDLLLTDMVMPDGISGRALAERLREDRADLKIIYTSGYSDDVARSGLTLIEGVDFLPKPYALRSLAEIVRRRLDHPM